MVKEDDRNERERLYGQGQYINKTMQSYYHYTHQYNLDRKSSSSSTLNFFVKCSKSFFLFITGL